MITSLALNVNVNQYENKTGVYYLTQKHLESLMENEEFQQLWSKSIVMIDEYDWIFFEGNVKQMENTLRFFHGAERVVGFTGSGLTSKEQKCLQIAFKTQEVIFPKLSSMIGDKRIKLQQELVKTNLVDFCQRIYSMALDYCKLTPVIIVAQQSYTFIENYFRRFQQLRFFPMKNMKGTKIEAQFDSMFASKNGEGQYGVFLLNEQQGRGTDLKTSHEIEFNGGLFLIVADVFSSRSTEQILGRVGRLHRKGTYKQIIYKQGSKETPEQVIHMHQQFLENDLHMKIAALQTVLGYQEWCQQELEVQRPQSNQAPSQATKAIQGDKNDESSNEASMSKSLSDQGNLKPGVKVMNEENKGTIEASDNYSLIDQNSILNVPLIKDSIVCNQEGGNNQVDLPQTSIKLKTQSQSGSEKKSRQLNCNVLIQNCRKSQKMRDQGASLIKKNSTSKLESFADHSESIISTESLIQPAKTVLNGKQGEAKNRYGRITGKRISAPIKVDQVDNKRKRL